MCANPFPSGSWSFGSGPESTSATATALRKSFSRDLMLSFNGNMFYYASDTPDGFLRPGRKSLDDEHLLEQLYREVNFCLTVENGIK